MTEPSASPAHTPSADEAHKKPADRATDIAYTINHALSCATTDVVIAPTISGLFGVQVGCMDPSHHHDHGHPHHAHDHHAAHDHHHAHTHDHHHAQAHDHHAHSQPAHSSAISWKTYRSEALHYFKGEVIGDTAAVPLTIAVQRFFPSFMHAVRTVTEPVAAPFFRWGAKLSAKRWAEKQQRGDDAHAIGTRAEDIYQNEMRHLPQAVVWNLFAFPIGVIGQKIGGHASSIPRIIRNKLIGAAISNGLLLGARAANPDLAQRWDEANSQHLITPLSETAEQWLPHAAEHSAPSPQAEPSRSDSWTRTLENESAPTPPGRAP